MTLPASGQITLNQVNVELDLSGTAQIGLGDAAVRGLFDVASGQISMSDGYGKSNIQVGQQAFTSAGTYTWTAPSSGVSSVSIVAVGGGGRSSSGAGGGGGELRYKNNISVSGGTGYTVVIGNPNSANTNGSQVASSTFNGTTVIATGGFTASSGSSAGAGGSNGTGDGGGNGGDGGDASSNYGSGGGAGGYSGTGGAGSGNGNATAGSGGGGGGGHNSGPNYLYAGGGGGVGILGQGSNGAANGGGGSGGSNGTFTNPNGGIYGGGGGAANGSTLTNSYGAVGAVRIIWPGADRQFPSTRTADE